jgi:alginate O-acetyltransferase complex protein AlgI
MWHGAEWTFIAWGLYYAILLLVEKLFLKPVLERVPRTFRHLYTMLIVVIGFVMFRSPNFAFGLEMIRGMFGVGAGSIFGQDALFLVLQYKTEFIVAGLGSLPIAVRLQKFFLKSNRPILQAYSKSIWAMFVLGLSVVYLVSASFNPFIYFQF